MVWVGSLGRVQEYISRPTGSSLYLVLNDGTVSGVLVVQRQMSQYGHGGRKRFNMAFSRHDVKGVSGVEMGRVKASDEVGSHRMFSSEAKCGQQTVSYSTDRFLVKVTRVVMVTGTFTGASN